MDFFLLLQIWPLYFFLFLIISYQVMVQEIQQNEKKKNTTRTDIKQKWTVMHKSGKSHQYGFKLLEHYQST